ncbi:MAG: rhodanese-like domain-containing protein [Bacteroidetes bacterium]|nr:rhodanese-like domain-containing protein [Bacteroidota bacterium]
MQQVSAEELQSWIKANRDITLIDIREDWERNDYNIGGIHIPLGELMNRISEIPKEGDVVLYCEKGIRSTIAIQRLEAAGYDNLINLSGGMAAWKATV